MPTNLATLRSLCLSAGMTASSPETLDPDAEQMAAQERADYTD